MVDREVNMNLKYLEYFVEIAEQKSIHKAAEALFNSQPNLTRAMQSLEAEMGEALLVRSNQGVELTDVGQSLYYYAKSIMGQLDAIARIKTESQATVQSKLSVSVARFFFSDDLIIHFYEKIKATHTTMNLFETTIEDVIEHVKSLQSELGVMVINTFQYPILRRLLELNELEFQVLGKGPIYVHFSEKSPLNKKEVVEIKDLIEYSYLHLPFDYFENISHNLRWDGIYYSDIKKTITMNNYHEILRMLHHVDAFMFGNLWNKEELAKGRIVSREVKNMGADMMLIWIKRKKEILSENAKVFLEFFKNHYSGMKT